MTDLTVYRAKPSVGVGPTVHVVRERLGFALAAACGNLLAEILADQATIARDRLTRPSRDRLERRGYCRHCLDSLRTAA